MARTEYINLDTGEPAFDLSGWPSNGDFVTFLGKNGYEYQLSEAMKVFNVGQEYEILDCVVSMSSSYYVFKGIPGTWNTVMFRINRPGGSHDNC